MKNKFLIYIIIFTIIPQISLAYVGPGLAINTILIIIGVLVSLVLLALAIVYYPIKRLIKKVRTKKKINK